MYYKHIQGKNDRGFTLIEVLVSVALFAIVMMVSVGTMLTLVDANRKSQSLKSVVNNLNFSVDSMARTIRTGYQYHCGESGSISDPQNCQNGDTYIALIDDRGDTVEYRYDAVDQKIERRVEGGSWLAFTAPEVQVEDMLVYVTGADTGDNVQPTVTISVRGRAGVKDTVASTFNVQTTVTQRTLNE